VSSEACVIDVQRIEAEGTLPAIGSPHFVLGERRALGGGDAGPIALVDPRQQEVVVDAPGEGDSGEARRD
jgi:hypothetical protein